MPYSPELLTEIATRHQLYLERYKTGVYNKYEPFLKKMEKVVRVKLLQDDITEFTRARFEKLLRGINQDLVLIQKGYIEKELIPSSLSLAEYEAGFESRSLNQVIKYDFEIPTEGQLKSAVLTNPLNVKGANGKLLMPFVEDLSKKSINDITNAIRSGVYQGMTTPQIIKGLMNINGQLAALDRTTGMMTRTGLQHISVQAREETWNRNKKVINQVQWTSTIDRKTSAICRGLDGRKFKINEGPRPPAHMNCRSTIVAVLDSRFDFLKEDATRSARDANGKVISVPADESYYEWLKRQKPDFQNSIIGPTRGDLLRDGGLSAQRFQELQLNKQFEPVTLEEMRGYEPLAFQKAGI